MLTCRKLFEEIIKVVNESNFRKICLVLHSEEFLTDLVGDVVLYYSILSSIAEMDCEEMQLDTLLQILTKEQFLTKAENKQINKHKLFSRPNKKQGFINVLSLKPLNCFSGFLNYLESDNMYHLQMKIVIKMSEINNDISYTRSASTNTLASTCTSSLSSGRISRQHGSTMRKSVSTPFELEASYNETHNSCPADLTRSSSFPSRTKLNDTSPSNSPAKDLQYAQEPSALDNYKDHLKHVHRALPILSKQGWTNRSNTEDHFINVTIVKSLHKGGQNNEYTTSSNDILEHQIQYSAEVYKMYNKMFEAIDSKNRQLILLEGNAGTGKTTFAYKFCKEWAEENVLLQYSHVILLQLRDIKPGMINKHEQLFLKMGKLKHQIYAEMVANLGNGVLFWLEGWDELHNDLKYQSVFTDLLSGQLFPQATIVVSTRPAATGSLRELCDFTHKFKLVGFRYKQIKEYVQYYCTNQAESFMKQLEYVPCLSQLAEVPMNLAILVRLSNLKTNQELPNTLTEIFHDYLMNKLQHHKDKDKRSRSKQLCSTANLPSEMQKVFNVLTKYAFEYLFHHKPFSEEELSEALFDSSDIPWDFDGFGMFEVQHTERVTGESKGYSFLYQPIQELLAALYLTTLQPQEQLVELKEIFGNKAYEMVWVFYAGITELRYVAIDEILKESCNLSQKQSQSVIQVPAKNLKDLILTWEHCHSHFMPMTTSDRLSVGFLLTLMLCCYEARNQNACRIIATHVYPDLVCRIEIPPNHVTPYLLLAVSYFISHSGKMWSLRCDASIQSGVELLCKYITDSYDKSLDNGSLWVWCFVVKSSQIDAYCKAIKSQQSLQWIHLLNGSCLGDEGTIKLCECLTPDCPIIKVELENCKIGSNGLKSIGRMLNINGKILHIDLRKNCFLPNDVLEFLHNIKNQMNLEYLLLDKEFIENPKISSILEEIKSIRKTNNAKDLTINYR